MAVAGAPARRQSVLIVVVPHRGIFSRAASKSCGRGRFLPSQTIGNAWFDPAEKSASASAYSLARVTKSKRRSLPERNSASAISAFGLSWIFSQLLIALAMFRSHLISHVRILPAIANAIKPSTPTHAVRSPPLPPACISPLKSWIAFASAALRPSRLLCTWAWEHFSPSAGKRGENTKTPPRTPPPFPPPPPPPPHHAR